MAKLRWGKGRDKEPGSVPTTDTAAEAILGVATAALSKPVELAEGPEPVTAGYGPDVYRFRLDTDDPGWAGNLLARCTAPVALDREATWLNGVKAAGFPAPDTLGHHPGDPALVLPEPAGKSLLELMLTDMTSVPQLLARLGELHARLHSLPTDGLPTGDPAVAGAPGPDGEHDAAAAAGRARSPEARDALAEEVTWLDRNRPSPTRTVVCHGELYPVNVFVDPEDTSSAAVFNWTAACLAGPEQDVASTLTAFWFAPFYLDNVMYRKGLEMARDSLASGYADAYRDAAPAPLDDGALRYWQAFRVGSLALDLAHHLHHGPHGPWDPMTSVVKPDRTLDDLRKRFWELTRA